MACSGTQAVAKKVLRIFHVHKHVCSTQLRILDSPEGLYAQAVMEELIRYNNEIILLCKRKFVRHDTLSLTWKRKEEKRPRVIQHKACIDAPKKKYLLDKLQIGLGMLQ